MFEPPNIQCGSGIQNSVADSGMGGPEYYFLRARRIEHIAHCIPTVGVG